MKRALAILLFVSIFFTGTLVSALTGIFTIWSIEDNVETSITSIQNQLQPKFTSFDNLINKEYEQLYDEIIEKLPKIAEQIIALNQPFDKIEIEILQNIARSYGFSELYLIDKNGVITNTSFTPDLNFNLNTISPAFSDWLNSMYGQERVFTERLTLSTQTGILNTYGYYSPKDTDFIIEISMNMREYIRANHSESYLQFLFRDHFLDAVRSNAKILDMDIYMFNDLAAWSVSNEGQAIDPHNLEKLRHQNEVRIRDKDKLIVYTRFTPDVSGFFSQELCTRVVYDVSEVSVITDRIIFIYIIILLVIAPLIFFLANGTLERKIVRPISDVVRALEAIGRGEYRTSIEQSKINEIERIAAAARKMQQELLLREQELTSHRKTLEKEVSVRTKELSAAKEKAESASQAKSEFLSSMSHELRTPLNAILGFAEILEIDPDMKKQQSHLQHIVDAGNQLLNLVNQVLDLSKIESGAIDINIDRIEIGKLIKTCCHLEQALADKCSVSLTCEQPQSQDTYVIADYARTKQVILNLLSNAIKYKQADGTGTVTITTKDLKNKFRITIQDNGPGIKSEDQENLFTSFYRSKDRVDGTGIGLAISKQLIELMNGSIGFESDTASGSTFWIELPSA